MSHSKLKLGLAISAIVAVSSVAQAADYKIGGHLNRMIRAADNGQESDTQHMDNSANASRLNITASGEFSGMEVEAFGEVRLESNRSRSYDIGSDDSSEDAEVEYVDIRFKTDWGTVSMGRGDGAARFTQRQDLSGTELADNFDNRRIASIDLLDEMGFYTGFEGDHVIGNYEGQRIDRLRYDAPSMAGMFGSVSFGEGRSWEAGLTYDSAAAAASALSASIDEGMRWIAAIGYTDHGDSGSGSWDNSIAASASALLPGGLNLTVGFGETSYDQTTEKDTKGFYIKPGYRFGNHAVSLSFGQNQDLDAYSGGNPGWDGESTAIAYQFNGPGGVDVYASYQMLEVKGNGGNPDTDDLDVFLAGARLRF